MSYPLVTVPLSIAMPDDLVKTVKSVLMKKLEELINPVEVISTSNVAYILDAVFHSLKVANVITYVDLAMVTLNSILKNSPETSRIDFIADVYPSLSIKDLECDKRYNSNATHKVSINSANQTIDQQFTKALGNKKN